MNIKQWYQKFGGEYLIGTEGRGTAGLVEVGDGTFMVVLDDPDFEIPDPHSWESKQHYEARREQEVEKAIFFGTADVMEAVNWVLDKLSYSREDREQILTAWKKQIDGPMGDEGS